MIACEELGELIQAINKILRKGYSEQTRRNLLEEIADVRVVCEQQMLMWGISESEITAEMDRKIERLAERMKEEFKG